MTKIRKGQAPAPLTRAEFHERFNVRFYDPAYGAERVAIARLEAIAWKAHQEGPPGRPQGPHHAPRGPWLCRPDISDFGAVAQDSQAPQSRAEALA